MYTRLDPRLYVSTDDPQTYDPYIFLKARDLIKLLARGAHSFKQGGVREETTKGDRTGWKHAQGRSNVVWSANERTD